MADTIFVNTSGWSPDEVKELDEMVKEDNSDRSKFLRNLAKVERKRRDRRAEYLRLSRQLRRKQNTVTA